MENADISSSRVVIEARAPMDLDSASIKPRSKVLPSPKDWRDQVLYFLMVDRFSDGKESGREMFDLNNPGKFTDEKYRRFWRNDGKGYQGGTLKGVRSKLDYLKGMGVTTIWITPPFKQRRDLDTYHGYGIQNFLEIDERIGSRQDLRDLVDAAHERGMYVILDIILNHTGNNFYYKNDNHGFFQYWLPWLYPEQLKYRSDLDFKYHGNHNIYGWRGKSGYPVDTISDPDDGVWPKEFQNIDWYSKKGKIKRWDPEHWENPLDPNIEFRTGDFFDLKDLNTDNKDCLNALIKVYKYWIALSDCDGFRIDTLKHISLESTRSFVSAIRSYTKEIGKHNFWLIGEVTGGDHMINSYLDDPPRAISAALDIGQVTQTLTDVAKGRAPASHYFDLYHKFGDLHHHRSNGSSLVTVLDDHDMIGKRSKSRFAADLGHSLFAFMQTANAVALTLLTTGVGCVYYGTEQCFNGTDAVKTGIGYEDRYVRESMFGGTFGAFQTNGCHFFNENHPTYLRIAAFNGIRNAKNEIGLSLRHGKQYLREVSTNGTEFGNPRAGDIFAWSRLHNQEVVIAINPSKQMKKVWITVDGNLHQPKDRLKILYRSFWAHERTLKTGKGEEVESEKVGQEIKREPEGRTYFEITLLEGEMVILTKKMDLKQSIQ